MTRLRYDEENQTIFIPVTRGVVYTIDGEPVSGSVTIEEDTIVEAVPAKEQYKFPEGTETSFLFQVAEVDDPLTFDADGSEGGTTFTV